MANYTGTDWVPDTEISTDIMATIDEGLGELNADLTDLGGRIREISMTQNGTYRVTFKNNTSSGNPTIAFIYARSQNGATHLSLFVNGYGYSVARSSIFELSKGDVMSWAVRSDMFAIDISVDSSGLTSGILGVFVLRGDFSSLDYIGSETLSSIKTAETGDGPVVMGDDDSETVGEPEDIEG